ncbi:DNA-binding transcriptional regulator, LysR family [Cohnella sp. OV330]|uniref:LysR family transcriptional regulator n=1 Tax=Cohnella sp. OV330 TaxID=1855288 RepID=UPI0008EE955D|nr:LysR family transcriptional regulator [Cohnella sp. OV330]SFB04257.1 DNA-binding transcriptional regulator, LysR family [Cohnella sp. OV330]
MIANMEWYRVFLQAAETANLTKAAQSLHMTQPSVSYAIKQLEEALGVVLFDRLSKGVRLTSEGQALYRYIRHAFTELDSAEHHMKQLKQYEEGRLRIGANGAIIKDFLLPSLDAFHARYPAIRIQLSQERTSRIVERLKEGSLDLGFVHLPLEDEEIKVGASHASPYCAVVGKVHADWAKEPLSMGRLAELPLLMLSPGSSTRLFIESWLRSHGIEAEADFELSSLEMLAEFAERGYGVAFVPKAFIASRVASGSLLELNTQVPLPARHFGMASRKDSAPSLSAKAFIEMLDH